MSKVRKKLLFLFEPMLLSCCFSYLPLNFLPVHPPDFWMMFTPGCNVSYPLVWAKNNISYSKIHRLGWERPKSHGPLPFPREEPEIISFFFIPENSPGTGVDPSGLKPRRVMKMPLEGGREDRDLQPVEVQEAKDAEVILPKLTRFFWVPWVFPGGKPRDVRFIIPICCTHEKGSWRKLLKCIVLGWKGWDPLSQFCGALWELLAPIQGC